MLIKRSGGLIECIRSSNKQSKGHLHAGNRPGKAVGGGIHWYVDLPSGGTLLKNSIKSIFPNFEKIAVLRQLFKGQQQQQEQEQQQ